MHLPFVIAVCSMKGGVGKSTTVVQLAAALAELVGTRILMGDLDGQGALASYFGVQITPSTKTMYELLLGQCSLAEARVEVKRDLHLVPADRRLYGLEAEIVTRERRENRLGEILGSVKERYPYVVLDVSPHVNWATLNALYAADGLVVPVTLEGLPMEALGNYLSMIQATIRQGALKARVACIVPTFFETRTKLRRANYARLKETFGELVGPPIHNSVKLPEAENESKTIFEHAPASQVAEDYARLAKEVIKWRHARASPAPLTGSRLTQASSKL